MTPPHLESLARAVEDVLGQLRPEHRWVVRVREDDRDDRQDTTGPHWQPVVSPATDDPDAIGDRDTTPAARGGDAPTDEGAA